MCEWGTTEDVRVKVPADLSSTGEARWRSYKTDACIASIVRALQAAGIDMRGSCCGHDKGDGEIQLQDGRTLTVQNPVQRRIRAMSKTCEVWIQRWFTIGVFILAAFVLVHVALGIDDLRTKLGEMQTRVNALYTSVNALDGRAAVLQKAVGLPHEE